MKLSTGELIPTRTVVWTAGGPPHPSLKELSLDLDERGRVPVDEYMRWGASTASTPPATARASPIPTAASAPRPRSTRSARRASPPATWPRRSAPASVGLTYRSRGAFVNLGQYKAVASGAKGGDPLRLPRLVGRPQLPRHNRAPPARSARSPTGGSACRSPATPPRSARSATRRPLAAKVYECGGSHRPLGTHDLPGE